MLLSQMKENQSATITTIDNSVLPLRRLLDMGFITGEQVVCTNIGWSGSPIAYNIRNSKIALRKKDADMIGVIL